MTTHAADALTAQQLLTPALDDPERSWQRQRMLRLGEDAGWYAYLAGDPLAGRYVLRLPDGRVRVLTRDKLLRDAVTEARRDEPLAWTIGQAYGRGAPETLERIGPLPRLYDRETTAERLGMSTPTLNARTRAGRLRALYIARRGRLYFADQIDGIGGDAAAARRWEALRFQLPSMIRPEQITYREAPAPRPLPLPEIPHDLNGERNIHAIQLAESSGWLQFIASRGRTYTIDVAGTRLELPPFAVLPFIWGLGDAHGDGDRVAYR